MRIQLNSARGQPTSTEISTLVSLFNQGQYDEAESFAQNLLLRFPKHGFCYKALGAIFRQQGRTAEALVAMQKAAQFLPLDFEAHYNLAVVLKENGRFDEAEVSYTKALAQNPNFYAALSGIGNLLKVQQRFDEAVVFLQKALSLKPELAEAFDNLAQVLILQGEFVAALELSIRYLNLGQNTNAKNLFIHCITRAKLKKISDAVLNYLVCALSEPWCNPALLFPIGVLFVKSNLAIQKSISQVIKAWPNRLTSQELFSASSLAAVANNLLLIELLKSAPICDVELERFLTSVRKNLLEEAIAKDTNQLSGATLNFYCALSRQCFINEYVFLLTDTENAKVSALKIKLLSALHAGTDIPVVWLVAVAAYMPLHGFDFVEQLLTRTWPASVKALLTQLVGEPLEEQHYRDKIPQLTRIEGVVSLSVRSQYEENPYPRWIKISPAVKPLTVNEYMGQNFPLSKFVPLKKEPPSEILVAGCGTGRHSIGTARKFTQARVLAIDLSLTSLSYAKRKTHELGLENLEYGQADIMQLSQLNRQFDVIESGGVLHHLEKPYAGWQQLLSILRPGGVMGIALYSEIARRNIVKARAFIAEHGYASTSEGIRLCRQDLMELGSQSEFRELLVASDFYSTSDCRDLLFHVQEHRMTLTEIAAFLRQNNLVCLGMQVDSEVLSAYKVRFPNDPAAIDLDQWQQFEIEHPDTFIGMYQFWMQKPE